MKIQDKIECSLILTDLSGFTQLLYQASHNPKVMELVIRSIQTMFRKAQQTTHCVKKVRIINTTGDGFIAISTGATPSRAALEYARLIQRQYEKYVRQLLSSVPFRQRVDLRIALHHGAIYEIHIGTSDSEPPLYIGDDLNLLARVIGSQTARRFTIAATKVFYHRLMLSKKCPIADEVILDRNRYPEQIEIYRIPETVPEFKGNSEKD
jgi:class 3 adenylate cyclase